MDYLVFRLYAPMASWGDSAVGEMRGTRTEPGEAALLGLIAAALGIDRHDESAHQVLRDGYDLAVAVLGEGRLLRDFHTTEVPSRVSLKGKPHRTRRDELLAVTPKDNPVLSTRDYRQDPIYLVSVSARDVAPYSLAALADAIRKPRYTLYLGRKSCPPAAPLWPQIEAAADVRQACEAYLIKLAATLDAVEERARPLHAQAGLKVPGEALPICSLHWGEHSISGVPKTITVPRKDRLLSRTRWQFGDRVAHVWHRPGER